MLITPVKKFWRIFSFFIMRSLWCEIIWTLHILLNNWTFRWIRSADCAWCGVHEEWKKIRPWWRLLWPLYPEFERKSEEPSSDGRCCFQWTNFRWYSDAWTRSKYWHYCECSINKMSVATLIGGEHAITWVSLAETIRYLRFEKKLHQTQQMGWYNASKLFSQQ